MTNVEKTAQELVLELLQLPDMNPEKISQEMSERVSSRTIYRWAKGESAPQQKSDYDALMTIYQRFVSVP